MGIIVNGGRIISNGVNIIGNLPSIVTNGLIFNIDAGNVLSYPGSGTVWYDLSGSGNNGNLSNGPIFDNNNGGSLFFNESLQNQGVFATVSTGLPTNNYTYEIWAKPTTITGDYGGNPNKQIVSSYKANLDDSFRLFVANGQIKFSIESFPTAYVSGVDITNNKIYNFAATFTGGTLRGFINSVPTISLSASYNLTAPTVLGIGRNPLFSGEYFDGNIYIVRIYNKVLSDIEILQNFNAIRRRYGL